MTAAHDLIARSFDVLLGPLDRAAPMAGLWIASAVSGVVLLWIFARVSNPAAIRAARKRAQAELLAVRLYRDAPRVVIRAQARFLAALGRYLGHMLVPFAVLLVPFGIVGAQLDARYGSRALAVGERTVVEVVGTDAVPGSAVLESADGGVRVESSGVRIPERNEISWRIRAEAPGEHRLRVRVGEQTIEKSVTVGRELESARARRMRASLSSLFLAPAEAAIDPASPIERIAVRHAPLDVRVLGFETSWLVVFLVVSAAVALALRRRMGVEF